MSKYLMKRAPIPAGYTDTGDIPLADIYLESFNEILKKVPVAIQRSEYRGKPEELRYELVKEGTGIDADRTYGYALYVHILTAPIERLMLIGNSIEALQDISEIIVSHISVMEHMNCPVYYTIIGAWYRTEVGERSRRFPEMDIVRYLSRSTKHCIASSIAPYDYMRAVKAPWMQITSFDIMPASWVGRCKIPDNEINTFAYVLYWMIRVWLKSETSKGKYDTKIFQYNDSYHAFTELEMPYELFNEYFRVIGVASKISESDDSFRYYLCMTPDDVLKAVQKDRDENPDYKIHLWGYWLFIPAPELAASELTSWLA